MKRAIIIVLDSFGIGEMPDADKFGDKGSNTLGNICKNITNLKISNMQNLGLGNIDGVDSIQKVTEVKGCYGRMSEASRGKDTTVGHWEIAGLITEKAFPTYPNGFPEEVIINFEKAIGKKIIGNYASSGTEILEKLGEEHKKTGCPIVYTSADSVFQVAAHEEVISIEELYKICEIAREVLGEEHKVARIIARPFLGEEGNFTRTKNRKDFSIEPPEKTMLNYIMEASKPVVAVGKIEDIFSGYGITEAVHTKNNMDGVDKTIDYMKTVSEGLIFTNLVDFDMMYGHRNDVKGYAKALEEFDNRLPEIINSLKEEDILILTADHGCDPTTESTDHSREYVPILIYGKNINCGINLGTRETFADIAKTVLDYLEINENKVAGKSFLSEIEA